MKAQLLFSGVVVLLLLTLSSVASAQRFTSPGYTIDASQIGASFGGDSSGGSYQLTSTGGESIIGQGSGGSYKLDGGYVAQLQNSMELTVQPSGLVAYYPLDETSGTQLRDASANELDANALNGPSSTTGQVDGAWQFDGTDDKLNAGNPGELSSVSEVTWSAWIYPTNVSSEQMFLSKQGANYFRLWTSKVNASFSDNGTQKTVLGSTTLSNNQWYHVAATFTAGRVTVYVNGNDDGSRTDISGPLNFGTGDFEIGQWIDADKRSFVGKIDEVKVYDRALGEAEIAAEYDAGSAGRPSGLSFAGDIIPGVSQTSDFDAVMRTDAFAYSLSVNQNQNLTKGGDSIPGVSGTVASPAAWSEGTTKGLGFTLTGATATAIDGKWSSGSNYAAFPGSATSVYSRTGQPQGTKDVLNLRLRLDVANTQPSGKYTNVITTTGTITP